LRKQIRDERFIDLIGKLLQAGVMDAGTYAPTYSGTPQGGIATPPTMLQTLGLFFLRQLGCERTHPENHADSFLVNFDPLDQRPYQLAPCLPIRRLQPGLDPRYKCLQSPQYELQFLLHVRALTKLFH